MEQACGIISFMVAETQGKRDTLNLREPNNNKKYFTQIIITFLSLITA